MIEKRMTNNSCVGKYTTKKEMLEEMLMQFFIHSILFPGNGCFMGHYKGANHSIFGTGVGQCEQ